jgi:hypothetical protein
VEFECSLFINFDFFCCGWMAGKGRFVRLLYIVRMFRMCTQVALIVGNRNWRSGVWKLLGITAVGWAGVRNMIENG